MIPVSSPTITNKERDNVVSTIEHGWISSKGEAVIKLEKEWADYCKTTYAVSCSSGTTALHLALASLRIGPGDEVIVPNFTMIATAWAVSYLGAKPVFVDCRDDYNIDVSKIENYITPRTKAIVPVHIYGRVVNMPEVMRIAHEYNLFVVEDAAEAHGAELLGKKVGAWGDIGCFSLFGNKIITSGEGGLITTNDERLYRQICHLRGMAFDDEHTFLHKKLAYNYRMTSLQAAFASAQVGRIDEILRKRKQVQKWYDEYLDVPRNDVGAVPWVYDYLLPEHIDRNIVIHKLAALEIEARRFFVPMTMQPMYYEERTGEKAYTFSKRGLYLPLYPDLSKEEVKRICNTLLSVLEK